MKQFFNYILGALLVMVGIFFFFNSDATLNFYALYIGIGLLLSSVTGFVILKTTKVPHMPYGTLATTFALGLMFLFIPSFSVSVIVWFCVFIFFAFAVFNVFGAFSAKGQRGFTHILSITFAVLVLVLAIMFIMNPNFAENIFSKVVAFSIMMNGVSYFVPAPKKA